MKIGNSNLIKDAERYIKRCIKGRYKFSKALVIGFLISGFFSSVGYGAALYVEESLHGDNNGDSHSSLVWTETLANTISNRWDFIKKVNPREEYKKSKELVLLSYYGNKLGEFSNRENKDANYSVIIGSRAIGGADKVTVIGQQAAVGINAGKTVPHRADDIRNKKDSRNENHQGTAVGYRTFSAGAESAALGNDVVSWGDSSIAIGSDSVYTKNWDNRGNYQNDEKYLSKDMFKLFFDARKNFNYTGEYPAVNFNQYDAEYNKDIIVDEDGVYKGYDKQNLSFAGQGKFYIREKDGSWDTYYVLLDDKFYKPEANTLVEVNDKAKIEQLKQTKDYKRREKYLKQLDAAYNTYKTVEEEKKAKKKKKKKKKKIKII